VVARDNVARDLASLVNGRQFRAERVTQSLLKEWAAWMKTTARWYVQQAADLGSAQAHPFALPRHIRIRLGDRP
jgi:hypothetical protein